MRNLITAREEGGARAGRSTFRVLHAATAWLLDGCGLNVEDGLTTRMATMRFVGGGQLGVGQTPLHLYWSGKQQTVSARGSVERRRRHRRHRAWQRRWRGGRRVDSAQRAIKLISTQAVMSGRTDLARPCSIKVLPSTAVRPAAPHFTMIKGNTPLAVAGQYARDSTIIDLLLRRGADPRQHIDEYGLTALRLHLWQRKRHTGALCARRDFVRSAKWPGRLPFTLAACLRDNRACSALRDEFPKHFERRSRSDVASCAGRSLCASAIGNGSAPLEFLKHALDAGSPSPRSVARCHGTHHRSDDGRRHRHGAGIHDLLHALHADARAPRGFVLLVFCRRSICSSSG